MMTAIAIIFIYAMTMAALVLLLLAKSDRTTLVASTAITLLLGSIMWLETHENLLFLSLLVFLFVDMGLIFFAPMLRVPAESEQPIALNKQLYVSQIVWMLLLLCTLGVWSIWSADWSARIKPVSKVFSQSVYLEFWTTHWPHLMVLGLLMVGVAIASLLMVKFEQGEVE